MKCTLKAVLLVMLMSMAGLIKVMAQPTGAINGVFSIGEGQQVYFSKGNLQYQASTNTWRFADNQWDYVGGVQVDYQYNPYNGNVSGSSNNLISSTYSGWIDLFGYGTSGWNSGAQYYQPWSNGTDYNSSEYLSEDMLGAYSNADWGIYNAISNGGNQQGLWRTLTAGEWNYLVFSRPGIRYARATVNGVCGLILLPDGWNEAIYGLNNKNQVSSSFDSNVIDEADWINVLEEHGAVFLPCGGVRGDITVAQVNNAGYYWSASSGQVLWFYYISSGLPPNYMRVASHPRSYGFSVRLVRSTSSVATSSISVSANPSDGGSVTGSGNYQQGQTCTLTASPNPGYSFVCWMKNGNQVSVNSTYSFIVTESASYVAIFQQNNYSISATISPSNGGSITGTGSYHYGDYCVLTATPNSGYAFVNWTENGSVVATNSRYSFSVTENRNLVANFTQVVMGNLQFYLYDSGGDGWSGNYLAVGYTDRSAEFFTIEDGYGYSAAFYELSVPNGSHVVLSWMMGSNTDECSFTVGYPNGNLIYYGANLNASFSYEFDVDFNTMPASAFTIAANSSPTTGGSVTGAGIFNNGSTCTLTALPNSGYAFTNWTENGNVVSTNMSYSFTVSSNRSLVANFTSTNTVPSIEIVDIYGITPYSAYIRLRITNDGGSPVTQVGCDLSNGASYGYNNITSNDNVIGPSGLSPGTTYTAYPYATNSQGTGYGNPMSFTTLPADYEYEITTSASPAEGGMVSGGGTFHYGETCTLTAIPNAGYSFSCFQEFDGIYYCTYSENPVSFEVTRNSNFVAYFSANNYTINASVNLSEGGSVSGGGTLEYGSVCTLTATANSDYTFTNWTENGEVVSTEATYEFVVSGDRTLVANFTEAQINYTIGISANPAEGGTVSGGGVYTEGTDCTLTATANEGWIFTNWTENDAVVSTSASYTFTVTGDRTLVANFTVFNPTPEENLVAYYPFDGDVNDYSGNGNHGTIIGNVVPATDRHGNSNGAYRFPGEAFNYISVPDADILHLNAFTLSAWVYTDADNYGSGILINKGRDITNGSYRLNVKGVGAQTQYSGSNGASIEDDPELG
ncbi:MAG: hypothetical protein K6G25_11250 [Bacteroidales bacterium]|nr:hypothetical protein [Bacteroidales bacterium]